MDIATRAEKVDAWVVWWPETAEKPRLYIGRTKIEELNAHPREALLLTPEQAHQMAYTLANMHQKVIGYGPIKEELRRWQKTRIVVR